MKLGGESDKEVGEEMEKREKVYICMNEILKHLE